jgi:VWFA-related protein
LTRWEIKAARMDKDSCIFILLIFLFFYVFIGMNSTANQTEKAKASLQYEVTVTMKLVQVYVTDKKGNPITDLEKPEFLLWDNDKPVEITEFEKHILMLPETKTPQIKPDVIPESLSRMNRKFFLFFDFAFNQPNGIMKARKAAIHFINKQLHPSDEVGILSYSAKKGLTLHEYLTSDHKKILEIVQSFGMKEALGRAAAISKGYWDDVGNAGGSPGGEIGGQISRMESKWFAKKEYESEASAFSKQLQDLAKALRYIPGSKHIIFFSNGISNSVLYGDKRRIHSFPFRPGSAPLRTSYEKMSEELAAANAHVYPVNTLGLAASHFVDRNDMGDRSLHQIARLSGGKYFDNIQEYEQIIEEIQNLTSAYYVLGYYIDEKWDGKYHDIKVKVKRKGCQVHGQVGYFNPKPFTEYTRTEKMLHLIDLALSDKPQLQEPIHFPAHASQWKADEESNVLISAKIPGDRLKEIQGRKMEVVTLILNQKNYVVELKQEECGISQSIQDDMYSSTDVSLPPGEYDCRVIIRNLETGKGAVGSSSITISKPPGSGLSLLPPVLFVHKEGPLSLGSMPGLSSFGFTDCVPVVDGVIRKPQSIIAYVNIFTGAVTELEIKLSVQLVHLPSEKEVPISSSIARQRKEKENQTFVIEIPLDEVQPGKYSLNIIAEELKKGSRSQVTALIQVTAQNLL